MLSEQAQDRFWAKVKGDKEDACWLWQGAVSTSGYGNLRADKVYRRAHRTAYELCHGNIPDGMCVMHSCDVKLCCNPAHLSVGTLAENTRDAAEKGLLSVKKPM
ncbi:MAG: HNH endonuclease signature motif containing protein, partial [Oceanisphaera sp.]|nr:HNH endonuclease signature motif containing protein [Oceanisphaera sp.]